jgi:aryl-alcohol dehydrogenase-like predicted oxidoreductase
LLQQVAKEQNATAAQIALAWLLAKKPWFVSIPGTTKANRLEENLGAVEIQLSSAKLEKINQALLTLEVKGARYSEQQLSFVESGK